MLDFRYKTPKKFDNKITAVRPMSVAVEPVG